MTRTVLDKSSSRSSRRRRRLAPWRRVLGLVAVGAWSLVASACTGGGVDDEGTSEGDESDGGESEGGAWDWNIPEGIPAPVVPEDNPMSLEKVELGRRLFYDPRLSGNQTQSCASCHEQALAFTDARATSPGSTGEHTARNSQSLINAAYFSTLTWANPVLERLEEQALVPIFGEFPVELGVTGVEDEVLARFAEDPDYTARFAAAFPDDEDPVSFGNIARALASFVRAMTSMRSPYDRYVYGGEQDAMSDAALRGMELFFSERMECHHCHNGFAFTISTRYEGQAFSQKNFQNTGQYNLDGMGAYPANNTGLFEHTGNPFDMGRFRPPSLRNVALTPPYGHDGSVATLEEVIDIYARGGRLTPEGEAFAGDGAQSPVKSGFVAGFEMSDDERADMLAFMESLTDEAVLSDPSLSDPFAAP